MHQNLGLILTSALWHGYNLTCFLSGTVSLKPCFFFNHFLGLHWHRFTTWVFLAAQCPDEAWTASSQSPVSDVRTRPFIPHRLSVGPVHGSVVRAGTSQLYVLLNASTRDSFRKLQKPVVCMLITTIPSQPSPIFKV